MIDDIDHILQGKKGLHVTSTLADFKVTLSLSGPGKLYLFVLVISNNIYSLLISGG